MVSETNWRCKTSSCFFKEVIDSLLSLLRARYINTSPFVMKATLKVLLILMIARSSDIFDDSSSIAARDIAFSRDAYSSLDSSSNFSRADNELFVVLSIDG